MAFKIIFSVRSVEDLEGIANHIAQDNEEAARRLISSLLEHVRLLADFPFIGSPFEGRQGIRKLIHTPYLIFHRVLSSRDAVEIVCFWHAARGEPNL